MTNNGAVLPRAVGILLIIQAHTILEINQAVLSLKRIEDNYGPSSGGR